MGHKVTCILLLVLMLTLSTLAGTKQETCEVAPSQRKNCGYPGVTAKECEKRRCCFQDAPYGFPWCFHPMIPEEQCKVPGSQRKNCGYPGVTAEECMKCSCCFDDAPYGYPWCFHPITPEDTADGTDEEECSF